MLINKYRPFKPIDGYNDMNEEIKFIKKQLVRWAISSAHWGPRLWHYLHSTAQYYKSIGTYTDAQVDALYEWFKNIESLIPCHKCKYWFMKNAYHLITLDACKRPDIFFNTIVDIHNMVNIKLDKSVVSYEDAASSGL